MSESDFPIDAALLDRLVDGELDPRSQAKLLSRLDERPGRWRRLALAFVEAQTLSVELHGVVADAKPLPALPAHNGVSVAACETSSAPWTKFLSLAATMLIAVGVGFGAGRVWNGHTRPQVESAIPPTQNSVATTVPLTPATLDELGPEGMMTVHTADGSPVQLPVYEASQGAERMLTSAESSVPPEVIRALRSRGHEVKQQRRYWPVDLGDGRQIIVPIDQVDVQYVGNRAYQ